MHQQNLKILMVAPQPFFSARGTPFSVLHRIRALTNKGHSVDLVTYPIGDDIEMQGLEIMRSRRVPFVTNIKVGPSISKIFLDLSLFFETRKALKKNTYDVIHSHEEAAFFCARLAKKYSLVHIYDMHSSLPQQLANFKNFNFRLFKSYFEYLENYVLETCDGVITICDDLAEIATQKFRNQPHMMIENFGDDRKVFKPVVEDVEADLELKNKFILLYSGTFEIYQGLDILLEAMVEIKSNIPEVVLILVGGTIDQIHQYKKMASELHVDQFVRFLGSIHPSRIPNILDIADVIVSPRSRGTNTPLKIYGYLRTGTPIVATDLYTHRQILNENIAVLVPPTASGIASGIDRLKSDKKYALRISKQASQFAIENFPDKKYIDMVSELYDEVLSNSRNRPDAVTSKHLQ